MLDQYHLTVQEQLILAAVLFGSKQGLSQLVFGYKNLGSFVLLGNVMLLNGYTLSIIFNDGTTYNFADTLSGNTVVDAKINQTLTVGGGSAGGTLRFNNLPTGPGNYPAGTVYRSGNQLMIV